MVIGRVIGTLVASRKYEGLEGQRFLLVQQEEPDGKKVGDPVVAVDTVRAGPGDRIFMVTSREAALALTPSFVPVDHTIVGFIDSVDVEEV
jgi:ethanolamine utilization protein EutN